MFCALKNTANANYKVPKRIQARPHCSYEKFFPFILLFLRYFSEFGLLVRCQERWPALGHQLIELPAKPARIEILELDKIAAFLSR